MFANVRIIYFVWWCFSVSYSYKVVFLPGSFVNKQIYFPLVEKVQHKLLEKQIDHTFSFGNNLQVFNQEKNTILICHSFSSFFALLNCKYDFAKNIKGCVFINGNFNQRQKMPYSGIQLLSVQQPILMLLNSRDERLPIAKAIDDLYVRCDERITNKFFMVNPGTHFSSFTQPGEIETVSNQICDFIESVDRRNFTTMNKRTENLALSQRWFMHDRRFSSNLQWVPSWIIPYIWLGYQRVRQHYVRAINTVCYEKYSDFLRSTPTNRNYMYSSDKCVLYKTNCVKNIEHTLREYFNLTIHWNVVHLVPEDHTATNFSGSKATLRKIQILGGLVKWLYTDIPKVNVHIDVNDLVQTSPVILSERKPTKLVVKRLHVPCAPCQLHIVCDLFVLPIKDQVVYYKFPSKTFILQKILEISV